MVKPSTRRRRNIQKVKELYDKGYTSAEVSDKLSINKSTIWRWKRENRLQIAPKKYDILAFKGGKTWLAHNLAEHASIKKLERECVTDLLRFNDYFYPLVKICQVTRKTPAQLLTDFQTAEEIFLDFQTKWAEIQPGEMIERYRKAVRKFLKVNGVIMKDGAKILKGGSDSRGDYSDMHLSDREYKQGLDLLEKFGGHEFRVIFAINHEIFPRPDTLSRWVPNIDIRYTEVDGKTYDYGFCEVYEPKQKKKYKKMILEPETLKMALELPQGRPLTNLQPRSFKTKYSRYLRKFYKEVGKIDPEIKYKKGEEGYYWTERPIHSIRHSAAIKWLRRTAFNASLVSNMGWDDSKTLTQFYASTTVEQIMEAGRCWYCRPPMEKRGDSIFCSASHALAYLNGGVHAS